MSIADRVLFLKKALGSTAEVGAVTMSSKYVVEDVLKILPTQPSVVIEYGSGEGVMTRALLERLPHDGKMLAIESNGDFVSDLNSIGDSRLKVLETLAQDMSAEDMMLYSDADVVLSSIPFSFLNADERKRVVSDAFDMLKPGGVFVIFHQYSWLMYKTVREVFGMASVRFEPRNMLPCFIISAIKKA